MRLRKKDIAVLVLTFIALIAVFQLAPISQPGEFHQFADDRRMLGIKNFCNVFSNLFFVLIAGYGFARLNTHKNTLSTYVIYSTLFLGVGLTALGSGYYHSNPNNQTLVWDRLPMTIIFMSLTCVVVAEFVNERLALILLMPLLFIGTGSVLWWSYTQTFGHGDLRLYFFVQYYPMVLIPLILWLYYTRDQKPLIVSLVWVIVWYSIAKVFERFDVPIYHRLGVSGHTLKHLAAAASTWYFVQLYSRATLSREKRLGKLVVPAIP